VGLSKVAGLAEWLRRRVPMVGLLVGDMMNCSLVRVVLAFWESC